MAILLEAGSLSPQQAQLESWIDSPEAYFATQEERGEWRKLTSSEARAAFIQRYWLRRDPTPGTETNEFRERISDRIHDADERFGREEIKGSTTARGRVFVVFGPPAEIDRATSASVASSSVEDPMPPGVLESDEIGEIWIYDRHGSPRLLGSLKRATLQIAFGVSRSGGSDRLQNTVRFLQYREIIARSSVVNVSVAATVRTPLPRLIAASLTPLSFVTAADTAEHVRFGHLVLWPASDPPTVTVWFALPPNDEPLHEATIAASLTSDGNTRYFSTAAAPSHDFAVGRATTVYAAQIEPEPGRYEARFSLRAGNEVVASAKALVHVPNLAREFSVSSIIVTDGPYAATESDEKSPFCLGKFLVTPRADSTYSRSDSLWYFFEVSNPSDPEKIRIKTMLRRPSGSPTYSTPQRIRLKPVAEGHFFSGYRLPLVELEPGDYTLYATFTDEGTGAEMLRRADFRVIE